MTRQQQSPQNATSPIRPNPVPDYIWAPFASGGLMLLVGLLGLAVHQPLIFPSLGPTAFLQAEQPDQPSAKFYNVVVGHLLGLFAGLLAVKLLGADNAPSVLGTAQLAPVRVWAAVLAGMLNMLTGLLLHASHPPAAATTLLVALGGFKPTIDSIVTIMTGVFIVAVVGEALRQIRLRQLRNFARGSQIDTHKEL
ncbi:HPP family protein [Tolypothrix sp. VBCCA 56010]|uniref:HPP family protein n=1 Tax=Tolypothrix sp. VBCCA 56010 TaxID=3137731 RepID=UPI003D7D8113